ncbi:glycosyltransferase family 4 protein [Amphibacillus sediminis]|uniref:glycosyltransferase family 4 protein n=1 Tax=Amphibacillus sediminis TaxID=360185 RepID=UPI00082C4576|nr:glycosyltransferase family 4 protein [Amphibacillus sediminis]
MKRRIKILYIVSNLRRCGPTNQLLGIMKNIDNKKFDISVLTLSPEPDESSISNFVSEGISVNSLNLSRHKFVILGKQKLKKFLISYKPDIIHTSGVRADSVVSKIKKSGKHIMTIRNYVYEDYISKFGYFLGFLLSKSAIRSMKKDSLVVLCSFTLKYKYKELLSKKLYVVQNGVDTLKYKVNSFERYINLRKQLNLSPKKRIFLVVGSLIERKDPLTIINAFLEAKVNENAQLVILGDGYLLDECKKHSIDSILLRGNVNNVDKYLQASDVYISASKSEGLPNSVLEAGSSGKHLLLSNIPEHKEIIDDNKLEVDFFNIGDIKALSKLIKDYTSRNIEFSKTNEYYFGKNYSNKKMSENYQKIYTELLSTE